MPRKAHQAGPTAKRIMRVRALDPQEACGPGTTVLQLYVVEGLEANGDVKHLVFLDSHGWYCTHGRDCAAVTVARRAHGRAHRGQRGQPAEERS